MLTLVFSCLPKVVEIKHYRNVQVLISTALICWYKALRSAGGLRRPRRSLRKKKYIEYREADRRSMIEHIFL